MWDKDESIHQVTNLIMRRFTAGHLAHTNGVQYLAHDIVRYFDGAHSHWAKWSIERTKLLDSSKTFSIPVGELQEALNALPGPSLTATDVEQRLKLLLGVPFVDQPREDLRDDFRAIFSAEKAKGTEFVAIVGAIRDFLDKVELREYYEGEERKKHEQEAERLEQEKTLRSGVDCDWLRPWECQDLFLRKAGRLFRLRNIAHLDWEVSEIPGLDRVDEGKCVGRFKGRGCARTAIYDMIRSGRTPERGA
jgi:hypothetical protein